MPTYRLVIIGALLAALCGVHDSYAQGSGGGNGFFLESIAQDGTEGGSALIPDANEYEIDLSLPSGINLYSSFNRSEVADRDLIFNTAISETSNTGVTLSLGSRTSMSFSREEATLSDVLLDLQTRDTTTSMSFSQGFGGGSSSGTFSMMRSLQSEEVGTQEELRTLIQSMALDTGLGGGAHLSAGFTQKQSEESAFRLQETGYNADLKMALSGGDGLAHYDYLQRLVEGRGLQQQRLDVVAPFAIHGGVLTAEHHLVEKITDERTEIDRETSFVVPLDLVLSGAHASYLEVTKVRDDNREEKSTLSFFAPMRLLGHDASIEHIATELVRGENVEDQRIMRFAADFGGSKGLIERTETIKSTGDSVERRERLRLQSPRVDLISWMSIDASQVRDALEGEETSRRSQVALNFDPFEPLEIRAIYTKQESPGEDDRVDHDIRTAFRLSPNSQLTGSILEKQQEDGSPAIVRHLEMQRQISQAGNMDLRVGYASYGAQEEDAEQGMVAEVSIGDDSDIGLSASYAEYDERKMTQLVEPSTKIELRAGDPSEIGLRAGYLGQAGRPEPERSLGLAMNAFDGALRLDYIRNPLDPRGRDVMVSDVYELAYKRTILGSVSMDLGWRYYVPREVDPLDRDHFFKLQLDGGNVNGGGLIALKYLSGHFVPYPRTGEPPASLLDLTYEKRWSDEGRLLLSLSREEPPRDSIGLDDNLEAQVTYQTAF